MILLIYLPLDRGEDIPKLFTVEFKKQLYLCLLLWRTTMELKGYGRIGFGKYIVGGIEIELKKVGDKAIYTRADNEVTRIVTGFTELVLQPIYPVLKPKYTTSYILVELEYPIDIAPGSATSFWIRIPADPALYVYKGREYSVLDVIPIDKPRYTLYGTPTTGLIARYCRSSIYSDGLEHRPGYAYIKVRLNNRYREWATVTRILLDAASLRLYYREDSWEAYTQEIEMTIDTESTASISYGKPVPGELKPIDDPPELRQPRIVFKTDMLWGI